MSKKLYDTKMELLNQARRRKLNMAKITNPIIPSDYPDVDVIRVEDTYYMVSTTMHFMPGSSDPALV